MEVTKEGLARFFEVVQPHMNEVQRRVVAGAAAEMLGRGGKSAVAAASGMSRNTVIKAEGEVQAGIEPSTRLRAPGGGDKSLLDTQPGLLEALDELVNPETRGNPMSKLRWTSKSSTKLAAELVDQGFEVSSRSVLRLLHRLGYSLQANAKVAEGRQHPDRDAQFNYLNDTATAFIDDGQPVISVDTKKKELLGNYANGGAEWAPEGQPERVEVHDFADRALGEHAKAIPYGIYDIANNEGWVNVGDTADTSEFAVESIRRWWNQMGRDRFPDADRLLITADVGGSNGYRIRAWKVEQERLAKDTGLRITVVHYPPGNRPGPPSLEAFADWPGADGRPAARLAQARRGGGPRRQGRRPGRPLGRGDQGTGEAVDPESGARCRARRSLVRRLGSERIDKIFPWRLPDMGMKRPLRAMSP